MRRRTLALLALCAGLLGGCVETRFESVPGDRAEACDPRWKGFWVSTGEYAGTERGEAAFLVDEQCRFQLLERPERDGPLKPIHIPLNFVHDGKRDYVVVADDQLAGSVHLSPIHGVDPPPRKAFFIGRYRISGDRLQIDTVDSTRVAHLVLDGRLDGTIDKTRTDLHVFVRGDGRRVLEILRTQPIFDAKPTLAFERRRQSLADYERSRRTPPSGRSR